MQQATAGPLPQAFTAWGRRMGSIISNSMRVRSGSRQLYLRLADAMLRLPIAENSSTCLNGMETWLMNPREEADRMAAAQERKWSPHIVVAKVNL